MIDLSWMLPPVAICLVAMAALGWFGLHVLDRGIIFIDLALAQCAALGATGAVYLGLDPDHPWALALSLLASAVGAVVFTAVRQLEDRVPTEAIIGIAYAVCAAAGVLLVELSDDPHGAEKIQQLLVGNIVWVRWSEIATAALAVAAVGAVHAVFHRQILEISMDPEGARRRGMRVALWDLLFYLTFGVVVTAIVGVVGVLLVFSLLIIPAVVGRLLCEGLAARLAVGYAVGLTSCAIGVAISYEHSTGPIIVVLLGGMVTLALLGVGLRRAAPPRTVLALVAGAVGLCAVGVALVPRGEEDSHHHLHADELAPTAADPLTRLDEAAALAHAGAPEGLVNLAALLTEDALFIRMEAHGHLTAIAGDSAPDYDPTSGPDQDGVWAAWAAAPPADRAEQTR